VFHDFKKNAERWPGKLDPPARMLGTVSAVMIAIAYLLFPTQSFHHRRRRRRRNHHHNNNNNINNNNNNHYILLVTVLLSNTKWITMCFDFTNERTCLFATFVAIYCYHHHHHHQFINFMQRIYNYIP
jgi:hypothetical protein